MKRSAVALLATALLTVGCGARTQIPKQLLQGMRPIGSGPRFKPPVSGQPSGCHRQPGPLRAHVELFAANRVILIGGGVGHDKRCYGSVVTSDPTGTVYFRAGATLSQLARAWGHPLTPDRIASFSGRVRVYVNGRPTRFPPRLSEDAEIVLEVGPYVPPHASFDFPRRDTL